jgi:hypothetical protein
MYSTTGSHDQFLIGLGGIGPANKGPGLIPIGAPPIGGPPIIGPIGLIAAMKKNIKY